MNISWLGHSAFKIEEKINNEIITVVTDPYDKSIGLRFPKTKADIITVSHYHGDHSNIVDVKPAGETAPFIIDRPGEYEVKGVFVNGVGSYHDNKEGAERGKSTMFRIEMNGVSVLHCGDLGTTLSNFQLEKIGEIDIMLIPVGSTYTIGSKEAAEVVRQVEPRIVIPMHYKIPGVTLNINDASKFIKEMGNGQEPLAKLKINKKDLPQEEIKLVVLDKQ
jgi:L-ascorbate metabolism protein UlaG (beta-lactamase superfamily)